MGSAARLKLVACALKSSAAAAELLLLLPRRI
jgi:hypothetical protein